ncbi:prenyltransferase/squalene oxidase repeat-containing protein [Alienimonas californiensis]|uniref:prenyltransferase/squalene oxidase repeat-containing protein n=1 Tax=Alienimonas californiensis TaxID=2527989 RepID=UPI0013FD0CA0|nr:prenyltransferase/squalene oxidase repeat-containing protein [Alienimonas californiensis]
MSSTQIAATLAAFLLALPAVAQEDAGTPPEPGAPAALDGLGGLQLGENDPQVDAAMDKAVAYLLTQQREDGAITDKGTPTAMTSLSIMALASVGVTPADPTPEGTAMRKALDYVLDEKRVQEDGYFGRDDGSRMYGHGIITLMLSEMLGMGANAEQDRLIRERLENAIAVILRAQSQPKDARNQGGWRYERDSKDSDLSVSVWQVMALRSAANDGLDVPPEAIAEAVDYLRRSYDSPVARDGTPDDRVSGFTYEPERGNPTYAMTAAGLLAMQVCGQYEDPRVTGAAEWLTARPPQWKDKWFSYGTYYYAQGMYQRGGEFAPAAADAVRELLLERQEDDGSWLAENGSERSHGHVYATALSMLSLSVKYHYLPIYQR